MDDFKIRLLKPCRRLKNNCNAKDTKVSHVGGSTFFPILLGALARGEFAKNKRLEKQKMRSTSLSGVSVTLE